MKFSHFGMVAVLAACGGERPTPSKGMSSRDDAPSTATPVTKDSAGIRLITIPSRAAVTATFQIDSVPRVAIGGLSGSPDTELRPGADVQFVRRSDGSLVLIHGDRLRVHEANGTLRALIGRSGAGPGEFRRLAGLCLSEGDTLVVYDADNRRVGIYDAALHLVRELSLGSGSMPWANGCLASGQFLVQRSLALPDQSMVFVERHRMAGSIVDTVGRWWASDRNLFVTASAAVLAMGNEVVHADPRDGTLTWHAGFGRVTMRMRLAESRRAIPPSERSALAPAFWSRPGSDPSSARGAMAMLERADRPTHYPMFSDVSFDGAETLWMLDYRKPPNDPWVYTAVTRVGVIRGRLTVPAQRTLEDPMVVGFTPDGVLLRRHDRDGALIIAEHRLTLTPQTGSEATP